jgi:hypothetical protein
MKNKNTYSHFQLLFSILQAKSSDLVFNKKVRPYRVKFLKYMNNKMKLVDFTIFVSNNKTIDTKFNHDKIFNQTKFIMRSLLN